MESRSFCCYRKLTGQRSGWFSPSGQGGLMRRRSLQWDLNAKERQPNKYLGKHISKEQNKVKGSKAFLRNSQRARVSPAIRKVTREAERRDRKLSRIQNSKCQVNLFILHTIGSHWQVRSGCISKDISACGVEQDLESQDRSGKTERFSTPGQKC